MKTFTSFFLLTILLCSISNTNAQGIDIEVNKKLQETTKTLISGFDNIDEKRKNTLKELGDFIVEQTSDQGKFNTLFVCTHNSRRSHIADLWFQYGLIYYGVSHLESFSGGTEATAFNPKAIAAIERAGFTVKYDNKVDNPVVSITPKHYPVWEMQSKIYTHSINPKSNFVAVMVCSDADQSCPVVAGATGRFSIPYNDPRYFDNTPSETQKYDETIALIGTEILYLTHYIKEKNIIKAELKR